MMKVLGLMLLAVLTPVAAATTVTLDMNTIILAVIGLMGTTVTGLLALRMATLAAEQKQIHAAVNSGKTAMETKIDGLQKLVLEQSGIIKTLEEKGRGAELAKAIASVPVVAAPVPAGKGNPGKLTDAIEELTEAAEETVEAAEKTVEHAEKFPKK